MNITLLGSLGNINKILVPRLIAAGHQLTVVTSSGERIPSIEKLGATAAVGTMKDCDFLTKTFAGSDLVYLMLAVGTANDDLLAEATVQGITFRTALEKAHVKQAVMLSSVGADAGPEAGALFAYHLLENELRKSTSVAFQFIRPVGFYSNLYANLPQIKTAQTIFSNLPADLNQYFVAPQDIAEVVFQAITKPSKPNTVFYAVSDQFTLNDFVKQLQQELKLPELTIKEISDEQAEQGMIEDGVPKTIRKLFLQMNNFQRKSTTLYTDLFAHQVSFGTVKLADFVQEFSLAYRTPLSNKKPKTVISERATQAN
jgi:uncharacterized protein YbjT (DUF2867 family)